MEGRPLWAALGCWALASGLLFAAVGRAVPEPYMDEVFHVPQAQRFCQGRFSEWDPMITTPPGLYLLSAGALVPAGRLLGLGGGADCALGALRALNLLLGGGGLCLLHLLLGRTQPRRKAAAGTPRALCALALAWLPPLYFFGFLFYTDAGAVLFALLSYLQCLDGRHRAAALLGACGVLFRQTNVVWVAFCAATLCARRLDASWQAELRRGAPGAGAWRLARFLAALPARAADLLALLPALWPYALVLLLFAAFVLLNGGLVLGDRGSHQACLHAAQLPYFCAFALLFSWPHLAAPARLRAFLGWTRRRPALALALTAACMLAAGRFSYAHPYLLADNRHYTFYVWRRLLQGHPAAKYLLAPGYVFAGWALLDSLRARPLFWRLAFLACVAAATVPQRLLEPRYFLLPLLLYRLHAPLPPVSRLLCELAGHAALNAVVFHVFLNRPFRWPDHPGLQRFMW